MAKKLVVLAGRGTSYPTGNWNRVPRNLDLLGDEEEIYTNKEDIQVLSTNKLKVTGLELYMEVVGPLVELVEQDGVLLAEIAQHVVVLPVELKDALMPHLGHKIAILRTDIPGKEFLFRVLPEGQKTSPVTAQNLCENEQTMNCAEVI